MKDTFLNELFLRAHFCFYSQKEYLFNQGTRCENIFIIINGFIESGFNDKSGNFYYLDSLGPGSVIGSNYILFEESQPYCARVGSKCEVFVIPRLLIEDLF